jgi:hypothetical protein
MASHASNTSRSRGTSPPTPVARTWTPARECCITSPPLLVSWRRSFVRDHLVIAAIRAYRDGESTTVRLEAALALGEFIDQIGGPAALGRLGWTSRWRPTRASPRSRRSNDSDRKWRAWPCCVVSRQWTRRSALLLTAPYRHGTSHEGRFSTSRRRRPCASRSAQRLAAVAPTDLRPGAA